MQFVVDIPDEFVPYLVSDPKDLPRAVLEAIALDGVRLRKMTVDQARRTLRMETREEVEAFLTAHGVDLTNTKPDVPAR